MELWILHRRNKAISRKILVFKSANFDLFKDLPKGIQQVSEGKRAKERWLTFKHHFF